MAKSTITVALVRIDEGSRLELFNADNVCCDIGDFVVVRTESGMKIGMVVSSALILRGSDIADLLNEMNKGKALFPVLCSITKEGRGEKAELCDERKVEWD